MNKNDLRYVKTETIIKNGFKKCVQEVGFEKTTVSMICELGLISRNAFYLHFTDKYDLLDRLFDDFNAKIIKSYCENVTADVLKKDISSATEKYINALTENRDDFLFLLKCDRKRMEKHIQNIIVESPIKKFIPDFCEEKSDIKIRLNIRYMFSAMVAYTELWFENYDKISKDEAVLELYKLCETPTLLFLSNFQNKGI